MSGQENKRQDISAITQANPCQVTTDSAHGYLTGMLVRFTDLNGDIPVDRGMYPLNNKRFEIFVDSTTTFVLKDPITHEKIDSTNFPAYVTGGFCNLIETTFEYEGE